LENENEVENDESAFSTSFFRKTKMKRFNIEYERIKLNRKKK